MRGRRKPQRSDVEFHVCAMNDENEDQTNRILMPRSFSTGDMFGTGDMFSTAGKGWNDRPTAGRSASASNIFSVLNVSWEIVVDMILAFYLGRPPMVPEGSAEWIRRTGELFLCDCRSLREHFGGTILNAIPTPCSDHNVDPDAVIEYLFKLYCDSSDRLGGKQPVFIFFCEYSQQRGPKMAARLRSKIDHKFPFKSTPPVYILEDGYKNFFASVNDPSLFTRTQYIPEKDSSAIVLPEDFTRHVVQMYAPFTKEEPRCGMVPRILNFDLDF